ncbi:MAG: glutaredoxin family protein [Chloroflexi bacterium]|nr:glutaredoxin family protein [Chloroflexota bacterium]
MVTRVVLYTRPDCHLCQEVKAILAELKPEYNIALQEIDISQEAELENKYGNIIPVLDFQEGGMLYGAFGEDEIRGELKKLEGALDG